MSDKPTPSAVPSAQILCPHLKCRKVLSVPKEARGQTVRCFHCQNLLKVPGGSAMPKVDAA